MRKTVPKIQEVQFKCNTGIEAVAELMIIYRVAPSPNVAGYIKTVVPENYILRHLDCVPDLGFMWDLYREHFFPLGQPSTDPEVTIKLMILRYL